MTMKKMKAAELSDKALNWAVAKCEDRITADGHYLRHTPADGDFRSVSPERYCTDWAQGGPIIDRECIATYASGACSVAPKNPDYWVAEILLQEEMCTAYGATPLEAAMRAFVKSKEGDEIEIPQELATC